MFNYFFIPFLATAIMFFAITSLIFKVIKSIFKSSNNNINQEYKNRTSNVKTYEKLNNVRCPICNGMIDENQKYCNLCGAKIIKKCVNCNTINDYKSKFCKNCGQELEK